MKIVRDFSVTSAPFRPAGTAIPWHAAWASPISNTAPGLVLDFAANAYGAGGIAGNLTGLMSLTRTSSATFTNAVGLIETAGVDAVRLTHEPVSQARLGLLLEQSRRNLLSDSDMPVNQSFAVNAVPHVLKFYGTGTVTLSGAYTGTVVGDGSYPTAKELYFTPAAGTLSLGFSGDVTAAQIEVASTASSYISTAATSVQRADDIATVSLGPWFNEAAGTFVFSGHLDGAMANDRIIEIDNGVTNTRLSLLWNTVLGKPQFQVWDNGSLQVAIAPPGNAIGLGSPFRVAMAYGADNFAVALNGSSTANDISGIVPTGLSTLRLGRSLGGAQGLMIAESLTYYPTRLSDAELQAISA